MKKELMWAACVSAALGVGVLLFAGDREAEGEPWTALNDQLSVALATEEKTLEPSLSDSKASLPQPVQAEVSQISPPQEPVSQTQPVASEPTITPISTEPQVSATLQPTTSNAQAAESPPVAPVNDGKIHINSADRTLLMELPGIGEKKAQAILDYRTQHGAFQNVTDLVKVKGIGAKMLEKMMPYLAL
ncbi:ComEA family DNA-binding protein [Saccharibacillus sp. JS10]|uniref:ComEA family DNA-binding protein n=1 Tax=Saccharibacillus sp. JS10 TaxID=2950552 RepID=UPI0021086040|nr:helix-hairpin-helix domain-containing protein [Saccharibacillus sp. JS10]MCQ4086178.1 helix-hairpin-helix domain-containing protein [Saccharibacillus sp. JS10]